MSLPNVVWISTHDINPDLGCYSGIWPGAEYALTPNLTAWRPRAPGSIWRLRPHLCAHRRVQQF